MSRAPPQAQSPSLPHCSLSGERQPARSLPAWSPEPRAQRTSTCAGLVRGSHRPFCIYFKVLDFVAFLFLPPCKVGHLLLFQLSLSFFGTRQILSFDPKGIWLSGGRASRRTTLADLRPGSGRRAKGSSRGRRGERT